MTTEPTSPPALDPPAPRRADRRVVLGLALANLGLWLGFFSPILLTLQLRVTVLAPDDPETTQSIVLAVGALAGILASPLAGRLSDRTGSRWGRRRPWLLGAVLLGLVGAVGQALSPTVAALVVATCVTQVGFCSCLTIVLAVLPDQVPPERRGTVAGILGITQAVATLLGVGTATVLTGSPVAAFVVPAVIAVAGVGTLCVVLTGHDTTAAATPAPHGGILATYWVSPRQHPDFCWAWLSRFTFFLAFASLLNYQVFYVTRQLGVATGAAAGVVSACIGITTVALVLGSVVSGKVSDRIGRRRPIVVGAALLGVVGLLLLATTTSLVVYVAACALAGLGQGIYFAVDVALIAEVLPDRERNAGKDLGLAGVASQLPQFVGPAVATGLLAVGFGSVVAGGGPNFTVLYLASAVFAVVSAVAVSRVRVR